MHDWHTIEEEIIEQVKQLLPLPQDWQDDWVVLTPKPEAHASQVWLLLQIEQKYGQGKHPPLESQYPWIHAAHVPLLLMFKQ